MGNTKSEFFEQVSVDPWWADNATAEEKVKDDSTQPETINKMEEFKSELQNLHQRRLKIIAEKKEEMDKLRQEVEQRKSENQELVDLLKKCKCDEVQRTYFEQPGPSKDVPPQAQLVELESFKRENQMLQEKVVEMECRLAAAANEKVAIENERKEYQTHVLALKDIIAVSKHLLLLRDGQIKELSQKIDEIQASLAEKELNMFSDELRQEYEKQLKNMKQLRVLYDERQRMDNAERNTIKNHLEEAKRSLEFHEKQNSELQARVEELEKEASENYDKITGLQSQLGLSKAECGDLKTELSVINQLFSQILVGFNSGQETNLDNLTKSLEENHDLLTQIFVNGEEISYALPKVLLDLISQVNSKSDPDDTEESAKREGEDSDHSNSEPGTSGDHSTLGTATEIVQNLPKVWRVLTELLSHQSAPVSVLNSEALGDKNPCYKLVETPNGKPTLTLSVSKTYIRLKDLIVEKKALEKETMRLKQLNTHLESRLQDQEKRLELVSSELSKTWNVVGKMQKQHQQLHTQEKILRYELAQKRKLLNELKQELEYCREKWIQAREKNSHTEEQWKQLRSEFVARKTVIEEFNNSGESGYSDDRESSSSDDDELLVNKSVISGSKLDSITESKNESAIFEVIQEEIENIENEISVSSIGDETLEFQPGEEAKAELIETVVEEADFQGESIEAFDGVEETDETDEALVNDKEANKTDEDLDLINKAMVGFKEESDDRSEENIFKISDTIELDKEESMSKVAMTITRKETREERLSRLEEEAKSLVAKTTRTSSRSIEICTKLDDLHEQYGGDAKSKHKDIADTYKKLEEDILQTIKETQNGDLSQKSEEVQLLLEEHGCGDCAVEEEAYQASTSTTRTPAEILARREERLQQMEEQAQLLVRKVQNNSFRGSQICSKLNVLHNRYGERPEPSADSDVENESQLEDGANEGEGGKDSP